MSYSSAAGAGITALGSAYASDILRESQYSSQKIVSDAQASYNKVLQQKHNEASNYNATQQLNIVSLNEMFVTAEALQQKQEIQKQSMAAMGKATATFNAMGMSGKTADRLKRQVQASTATAIHSVDDSVEKQQLNFIMERKGIEQGRISGKDYSVNLAAQEFAGNPMMSGLSAGLVAGFQNYATTANSTSGQSQWDSQSFDSIDNTSTWVD